MSNVGGALKHFFQVHREAGVEGGRFGFRPRLGRDIRRPLRRRSSWPAPKPISYASATERSVGVFLVSPLKPSRSPAMKNSVFRASASIVLPESRAAIFLLVQYRY